MIRKAVALSIRNCVYAVVVIFVLCTYFNFIYPYKGNIFVLKSEKEGEHMSTFEVLSQITSPTKTITEVKKDDLQLDLNETIKVLNLMGKSWTNLDTLDKLLKNFQNASSHNILSRMSANYTHIQAKAPQKRVRNAKQGIKENITLAFVSCGSRRFEALVMLKSAVMFSQDAALHVVMFGDADTISDVGQDILALKWTTNALGWDFTYELHLEWFPQERIAEWRKMYTPCATERLFFPSLLPHIDSLIYLDTDTLLLSNLTEFWQHFKNNMRDEKLAGLAANNEPTARGWYNSMAETPYYGSRGLNAGVMLMNLTQMRNFSFEQKSLAAHSLYREKLKLADQDILNIIFHAFPEKLYKLDCSYNFNWVHCGDKKIYPCHHKTTGESFCFCNDTVTNGVQIVHGNSKTFHTNLFPFLTHLYSEFEKFDLLADSPKILFENLKAHFKGLEKPCYPLTPDILYRNAEKYLQNLEQT